MTISKWIGDRSFYKRVLAVSVPIMIQTGITNFVNLLDNIMVGSIGTEAMSGVSIVNQFIFIFNLLIFGAVSAAGIFTAQYHGLGDSDGVRHTFRFKFLINLVSSVLCVVAFFLFDDELISLFLHTGDVTGNIELTLSEGKRYLSVMLIGLVPYAVSQVYASTMRETGRTVVPMVSSVVAVLTNLILNWVLIFGNFGAPALGVAGAAIATVISRFAELLILIVWGHAHTRVYPFLVGAYRSLRLPRALSLQIILRGLPLMANEFFWALAVTLRNQCYSTRGLEVVAAQNITSTVINVFNVIYMAIGSSIAIIVGNLLGAGKMEEAKDTDRKMITFSVMVSAFIAVILITCSSLFPQLYNTDESVRALASYMIIISALITPLAAFAHSAYFTLRSGGKVMITILFDSVYMWVVVMPVCLILSRLTGMDIHWLFALCQACEVIKLVFGVILLRRGTWVRQLVGDESLKR